MWVKICANTNLPDALHAATSGADAVGFVFAPSRRQVAAQQVGSFWQLLPPTVERVGVFGEDEPERIADAAQEAHLTCVQMHGSFSVPALRRVADLLTPGVLILPVVHWAIDTQDAATEVHSALRTLEHEGFRRVLLDAKVGKHSGGLGVSLDWQQARAVVRAFPALDLILAGGLTPANVAEAIRMAQPWGVDVASGVEMGPGRKDQALVEAMILAARSSR